MIMPSQTGGFSPCGTSSPSRVVSMPPLTPVRTSPDNLCVFTLKPTDTCLKELKSLISGGKGGVRMQVSGSEGYLNFCGSGKRFKFTFVKDTSGASSQDVLWEQDNRLDELGVVLGRLQVEATEEVFDQTRTKALLFDKEARKSQAKEIKHKSTEKQLKDKGLKLNHHGPSQSSSHSGSHPSGPGGGGGGGAPGGRGATSTAMTNAADQVYKRPIRQRVLQLLAIKAYNRAEITLRLRNDGLSEADEKQVGAILKEVGIQKSDDKYLFNKAFLDQVNIDWPAYSTYDKQLLKRMLERRHAPPPSGSANQQPTTPAAAILPPTAPHQSSGDHHNSHNHGSDGFERVHSRKRPSSSKPERSADAKKSAPASAVSSSNGDRKSSGLGKSTPNGTSSSSSSGSNAALKAKPAVAVNAPVSNSSSAQRHNGSSISSHQQALSTSSHHPHHTTSNPAASNPPGGDITSLAAQKISSSSSSAGKSQKSVHKTSSPPIAPPASAPAPAPAPAPATVEVTPAVEDTKSPQMIPTPSTGDTTPVNGDVDYPLSDDNENCAPLVEGNGGSGATTGQPPTDHAESTPNGFTDHKISEYNWNFEELYPTVQFRNQRQRYRSVFDADYKEYMICYDKLAAVAKRFEALEGELNKAAPDSRRHHEIEESIRDEYNAFNKNREFQMAKKQHAYLRAKLQHIKQQVLTFDLLQIRQEKHEIRSS